MKDIPHWDVDEDYIVDATEGHILFSAENANKQEIKLASAAPDLLEALQDMLSGWKYIREQHGDLYGVGWDRAQDKAKAAISKALGEE
ncbi:hypothetical protein [Citrobacter sp. 50677481]|uniref:hypothetical protein n=1 Tax=Citrobacter sp. 50677481 TaxID=1736699 RepID=UPI0007419EB3|nr:hypothetical protein [Citrobacter sp. 50677481]KSY33598.1 hypothetical protein APU02_01335 [Citrobacter sp. 50677481]HCQ7755494.1 hypothetical protein [Citrobacter sedlakii]